MPVAPDLKRVLRTLAELVADAQIEWRGMIDIVRRRGEDHRASPDIRERYAAYLAYRRALVTVLALSDPNDGTRAVNQANMLVRQVWPTRRRAYIDHPEEQ